VCRGAVDASELPQPGDSIGKCLAVKPPVSLGEVFVGCAPIRREAHYV
jgi:hypothetical protein